jgi:hypothetical protein
MQIKEIVAQEGNNTSSIILFREGIFWRAYERSAFYFVSHIKPYQVTKKYFKNVGCEVAFCGFPNTTLDELLAKVCDKEIFKEDETIRIAGFEQVENDVINVWKNGIPIVVKESEPKYSVCENNFNSKELVLQNLRIFRVASSSPIECQQFLMEMQKQLDGTV